MTSSTLALFPFHAMTRDIGVHVAVTYLPEQSEPDRGRWFWAYHIRIENRGDQPVQLLTRHWIITDGNQQVQEVHGEGVVGKQPRLAPGEEFRYSSGAVLATPVGSMHGSYQLIADDGVRFEAPIAAFTLAVPRSLH